jgi:hypothetical protein
VNTVVIPSDECRSICLLEILMLICVYLEVLSARTVQFEEDISGGEDIPRGLDNTGNLQFPCGFNVS